MTNYHLLNNESKRIVYIRAICIFFIVLIHQYDPKKLDLFLFSNELGLSDILEYSLSRIISYSGVPVFYLMSGILLYSKSFSFRGNLLKKTKSLIIPYILWLTIFMVVYAIGQNISVTEKFFLNPERQVLTFSFFDFLEAYTGYGQKGLFVNSYWFLKELIILNIFAPVIKRIIDLFPLLIFFVLMYIWLFKGVSFTCFLNSQSICFFSFGYYVVKYNIHMQLCDRLPLRLLLILYLFSVILQLLLVLFGFINFSLVLSVSVLIGIVSLIKLTMYIDNLNVALKKMIVCIGTFSYFIYLTQDLIQTILKKLFNLVFSLMPGSDIIIFLLVPITTCTVCFLIGLGLKFYFPTIFNILNGSRKSLC